MSRLPLVRGALVGLISALLAAIIHFAEPSFFGAEWLLQDAYSRWLARKRPADARIVLVSISEKTIAALASDFGRPTSYTRQLYADVLDELHRAGAAVVAFDILFPEENREDPGGDRAFADAVSRVPTVLGAQTESVERPPSIGPAYESKLWRVRNAADTHPHRVILPHAAFHKAAGIGTIRMAPTARSSTIHNYPLFDAVGSTDFVPSLGLETSRLFLSAPREGVVERQEGIWLRNGSRKIPIDTKGEMSIRWNGPKRNADELSYTSVDFDRVLLAAMTRSDPGTGINAKDLETFEAQFRGKIVLVGFTAAGLNDLRGTPLSPTTAGVEIHANAIDNLINADFSRLAPRSVMIPAMFVACAIFGMLFIAIRSQMLAAWVAAATLAFVIATGSVILREGFIMPNAAATAVATVLTFIGTTAINLLYEQKETVQLRSTFGRYVSPQILKHILSHPEHVHLGGERRELTILFSDIRGFTTISEGSTPEAVVEMLNEYLTKMVDILLFHGGTLDKFIGDAVMGFWNAPTPDTDHARNAVACAIGMVRETARLRSRWKAEGKPALRIGIGINTGEAVVGNIGAEKVFGYTVIGDAVNLASRLEGTNKDYGTEIIISESTKDRIGNRFDTVFLEEVTVKGKAQPVRIYEVRGKSNVGVDAGDRAARPHKTAVGVPKPLPATFAAEPKRVEVAREPRLVERRVNRPAHEPARPASGVEARPKIARGRLFRRRRKGVDTSYGRGHRMGELQRGRRKDDRAGAPSSEHDVFE